MAYNPTASFISTIRIISDGEDAGEDTFNRPTEDLDSRTLFLKAQQDSLSSSLATAVNDLGNLQNSVTSLNQNLTALSAESIGWPGTTAIPTASDLADAVDRAAQLGSGGGGGGGGAATTIRFGVSSTSGTVITHNLANASHGVSVQISTNTSITPVDAGYVGDFYIVRGENQDTVYNTGGISGVLFDFTATPFSPSGTVVSGEATFNSLTGVEVVHNLGTATHSTSFAISDQNSIAPIDAASVGAIYAVRGENSDMVYNTGKNTTSKFTYIIS